MYRPEPVMLNKTEALWFNPCDTVPVMTFKKEVAGEGVSGASSRTVQHFYSAMFTAQMLAFVRHSYTHILCS